MSFVAASRTTQPVAAAAARKLCNAPVQQQRPAPLARAFSQASAQPGLRVSPLHRPADAVFARVVEPAESRATPAASSAEQLEAFGKRRALSENELGQLRRWASAACASPERIGRLASLMRGIQFAVATDVPISKSGVVELQRAQRNHEFAKFDPHAAQVIALSPGMGHFNWQSPGDQLFVVHAEASWTLTFARVDQRDGERHIIDSTSFPAGIANLKIDEPTRLVFQSQGEMAITLVNCGARSLTPVGDSCERADERLAARAPVDGPAARDDKPVPWHVLRFLADGAPESKAARSG